ncbi:MAG TPA: hypothetical protein VGF45_24065 [Polyangia bacterium]
MTIAKTLLPVRRWARRGRHSTLAASLSLATIACEDVQGWTPNPYESLADETVSLGAVDPVNFPAANLGTGGDRTKAGLGSLSEIKAFVGGQEIGYFRYAVNTPANRDPLRVLENGQPYAGVATPPVYAFDPSDDKPVPDNNPCQKPPGYSYDARRDAVHYDQQGNVFTALPTATYMPGIAAATQYVPVVAEIAMLSGNVPCQKLKSEKAILGGLSSRPERSGKYLAWLIVDPAAAIYPKEDPMGANGDTGIGLQRWGWYQRYLLAYLDGGYVPTAESEIMEGPMGMQVTKKVVRMRTQRLYLPRTPVMNGMTMAAANLGEGYDVLAAKRGSNGYSPLCEVVTYDTGMPIPAAMLPKDGATIEAMFGPVMPATAPLPRYVYCLQVR